MLPSSLLAASYPYQENQRLVGTTQFVALGPEDARLHMLARRYDIGIDALIAANPVLQNADSVDYGTVLYLPTFMIVPAIKPNQVVVNIAEKRLYFFHASSKTLYVWPCGIGRAHRNTPLGTFTIVHKREKPTWNVPEGVLAEARKNGIQDHPRKFEPSPINPLGDYAIHLSISSYLIHGTHNATHIGTRNTSGCINLYPEDMAVAYPLLKIGTSVKIINTPVKTYTAGKRLYIESHLPLTDEPLEDVLREQKRALREALPPSLRSLADRDLDSLTENLQNARGIPFVIELDELHTWTRKNPHSR